MSRKIAFSAGFTALHEMLYVKFGSGTDVLVEVRVYVWLGVLLGVRVLDGVRIVLRVLLGVRVACSAGVVQSFCGLDGIPRFRRCVGRRTP